MKRIIIALVMFVAALSVHAYEKRDLLQRSATEAEVKASLVMDQKWVPYPAYSDRNGWNNLLGNYRENIIKTGEKCLDYKWEVVKASQYLEYEKSGSRDIMEIPNNRNSTAFGRLLMAELAEGKGRFLTDIMDGVFYFCEQTTWAESAHLVAFQKSGRSIPDYRTDVLELKQGGLAQMLSWTYYFLHDQLDKIDPIISMRLRHELQKRELDPFINRTDFWWMAWKESPTVFVNNWNPWCNANALLCYMLLENDRDKLAKAVYKSMVSVDRYLNYVKADGACEEGATYWGHAFGKLFDYLSELQMITGGKVSLFNNKLVKDMGEFVAKSYIGKGYAVNFADASAHVSNYMALVYRCGKALGSREMMDMAVDCFKERPEAVTSVWLDTYKQIEAMKVLKEMSQAKGGYKADAFTWYPQTVNAYYNPSTNEICFPAGILQAPFFSPDALDCDNYGAIGVVIGHEMTHGFDDNGRQFDKDGNMEDWWTKDDAEMFDSLANKLKAQFDKIVVIDSLHANGKLTLGENIADQGGLRVAYTAYLKTKEAKENKVVDGFTPAQRFFLSYANVWADNIRPEEIRRRTTTDPHSLGRWRVNATLKNIDAFYEAFGIKEGDPMYIAPADRVVIW